ncbi:lipopolysaccharide biosynthesis protein [Caldimonas brevitalea]|uniref:Uncharacterized protein n=1 Tax=Caldimonas brevitalea TaxID=413882 RepID=A0A0G3BT46_9BURK|nr:polysaccharide biosynthesis C-terminal domain-containing protein [Caldimonas brevitalea]AKJ31183.1 hypothetical protein AAW51_4492 [Caldimonas brevitalea]
MSRPSLSRGALSHFAAKLVAIGLGLVIVVIVARQGPHEQGVFSLLVATESVYAALFSGLGLVIARQVSHHRQDSGAWLAGALALALLGGVLGAGVFAGLGLAVGDEPAYRFLPLLALAAPLLLLSPTVSGLYLGQGRMGPINAIALAPPIFTLAVLAGWWAWVGDPGLMEVLAIWLAARALTGALAAIWAWRDSGAAGFAWAQWRGQARFCTVVGLTNLVSWLNYRVDLFIVERYAGVGVAGVYSVAVTAAELLWFVSSSVSVAAYARIGSPDRVAATGLTVRVMHLNLAILLLVSPVLIALAWWVLPHLLGPAYVASVPLLCLLLPGVWAYASASTLSAYYTNFLGRPQLSAAVAALSLAVNVVVCALLVPRLGAVGGALATSASYLLAIGWGLALFRRHAGLRWAELLRPRPAQLVADLSAPLRAAAR